MIAGSYAFLSKGHKPDSLVVRAAEILGYTGKALDVGAGSLRNAKFLLGKGFTVTGIDKDPVLSEIADELQDPNLNVHVADITEFPFNDSYDLVIAVNTLPFLKRSDFQEVALRIKSAIKSGGILCVTFFGERDEWAGREDMTFCTRSEIHDMLSDMHIIEFLEEEREGKTIRGESKYWHIFKVIARKN